MELHLLFVFGLGAIFVVIALAGIVLSIRRMQGHSSRFDRVFETFVKAQGARVFPPSLRGNPDPLQQEVVEVDRGEDAVRTTPGEVIVRHPRRARSPRAGRATPSD